MFRPHLDLPARIDSSPNLCARNLPRLPRSYRTRGPSGSAFSSPQPDNPIPFRIHTSKKSAHNSFGIRTSKTQDLKSFRIRTYEKTRGEGDKLLTRRPTTGVCPERAFCVPDTTAGRPWGAKDISAVRITGHRSAQFANLPAIKHFNAAFRLLAAHYPLTTVSQRTANSQPPTYGIIPPHVLQSGRIQ